MENTLIFEGLASGVSLVLMGLCGAGLLVRFVRVLRGREPADGLGPNRVYAPPGELALAAAACLLSRLALFVLAYAMAKLLGLAQGGFLSSLEATWTHWDAHHYIGIARDGYTAVGDERLRLVFFPLYPWLMRLLAPATGGSLFASGTLISLLCASLSTALLYDLAFLHGGRETARRAAAYFLLSPLSVFLCCVYTESLFIACTLATVCLLRRGRPWLAALFGMASALTRMPGVIISGLLIIAFIGRAARGGLKLREALACAGQVLLVFAGLFVYWAVNWVVTGDPMTYLAYQRENWYQQPGSFWGSAANTMFYFLIGREGSDWLWTWGFQLLCMLVVFLLLAFRQKDLPFDLAAYSFVYVAVVLSPTWLLSGARYLYALCALPLLLSRLPFGRRGHGAMMLVSGCLLVVWVFGYTIALEVL
ncbi:MAG: hypothetical protein IJD94_00140 [Clostridia bacterium]|nr:hypothetical protein [Clostridia bacterium]